MKELEEMIAAITRAANAVAEHYSRTSQPVVVDETPAVEVKPKKVKAPKVQVEKAVEVVPEMTEEESAAKATETAKRYVLKFSKETPNGYDRARKILSEQFGVETIKQLTHEQRVSFINVLSQEMGD